MGWQDDPIVVPMRAPEPWESDPIVAPAPTPPPASQSWQNDPVVVPASQITGEQGGAGFQFVTPQAQDVAAARDVAQDPFVQGVAGEVAKVVPTSPGELARMIGESLAGPALSGAEDIYGTGEKLYGMSQGEPMEQAFPAEKPFTEYEPEDWGKLVGRVGVSALQALPLIAGLRGPEPEIPSRAQPSVADAIRQQQPAARLDELDTKAQTLGNGNWDAGFPLLSESEQVEHGNIQTQLYAGDVAQKIQAIPQMSDAEVVDALEHQSSVTGEAVGARYVKALADEASRRGLWDLYARRHPQSAEVIGQMQPQAAQPEIITPSLGDPFHEPEIPQQDLPYAGGPQTPQPPATEAPAASAEIPGAPIGVANRVAAAREEAGLLGTEGAPPSGIGVGWQDSVNAGNAAIDAGTLDPYKVVSDFQKNQLINGQRMGVARAWLERLQRANAEAQGALEQNPTDPSLAQAAQNAQDAENAYWRGYQPMKTEWSKVGTGMQETRGVTDTDLLSQKTAEQTMQEHLDRELTEADKARAAKAVRDTRTANGAVDQAFEKANSAARGAAKGPKMTDAQLRQSLADTLKEVTC